MRICDLCGQPHAQYNVELRARFGDIQFLLDVWAQKEGITIDICKDCAAKGALQVLSATPEKPEEKKP